MRLSPLLNWGLKIVTLSKVNSLDFFSNFTVKLFLHSYYSEQYSSKIADSVFNNVRKNQFSDSTLKTNYIQYVEKSCSEKEFKKQSKQIMCWVKITGSESKNLISIESAKNSWKNKYSVCICLFLPCTHWFLSGNKISSLVQIFHLDF